jgi:Asp-tRNA(Asn)/Glu-tRNA(Gln) amidotransferase A subunit family amidase
MVNLSEHSFYGVCFALLHATGGFVKSSNKAKLIQKGIELREKLLQKLGTNGVLFYPTFAQPAMRHCESPLKMSSVMYTMFFNIIGFPSTNVPVSSHNRTFAS